MAKRGPKGPTKPLTDEDFTKLVAMIRIQCTQAEVCDVFGMTAETLNTRLEERGEGKFSTLYKKHQGEGRASLRRMQWKAAEGGSAAMLIWLGKNMLGQTDKVDHSSTDGSMTPKPALDVSKLSTAALAEIAALGDEPDAG